MLARSQLDEKARTGSLAASVQIDSSFSRITEKYTSDMRRAYLPHKSIRKNACRVQPAMLWLAAGSVPGRVRLFSHRACVSVSQAPGAIANWAKDLLRCLRCRRRRLLRYQWEEDFFLALELLAVAVVVVVVVVAVVVPVAPAVVVVDDEFFCLW